ncbi:MAG: hypothetical protein R3Y28_06790 [Candidatus Gastranaerophilales bacterium]
MIKEKILSSIERAYPIKITKKDNPHLYDYFGTIQKSLPKKDYFGKMNIASGDVDLVVESKPVLSSILNNLRKNNVIRHKNLPLDKII